MSNLSHTLQFDLLLPESFIVTVDGGARTGTSSTARLLAESLHCSFLDSGAIYRSVTLACLNEDIQYDDIDNIIEIINRTTISFTRSPLGQHVLLNNNDVTKDIRTDRISKLVPFFAKIPEVRQFAHRIQHHISKQLVAEGRDMGTVVFPHANIKFFLTASLQERAKRHWLYLKEQQGSEDNLPSYETIAHDLNERDQTDQTRSVDPLRPADDALIIDTTEITIEEVVSRMLEEIKKVLS